MMKFDNLLIKSDIGKREVVILNYDEVSSSHRLDLGKFNLDALKRMGRVEAAKWVGESILFLLSGTQECFCDTTDGTFSILPPEPDANALEQLRIAMSLIVRAIELDSATPLDEAKRHLIHAKHSGLSLADELIATLLPKLQSSLRTDF